MKPRALQDRGVTLVELVLGIAVAATLSLVVARMFQSAMVSSRWSALEITLLTNARKALAGDASFRGLVLDGQSSVQVTTPTASALGLVDSLGVSTTYTLSASGNLLSTKQGAAAVRASGLSELSFAYYAVDSSYLIFVSTYGQGTHLVTMSFNLKRGSKKVAFFGGANLRNR